MPSLNPYAATRPGGAGELLNTVTVTVELLRLPAASRAIAVTYDGAVFQMYVNGVPVSTTSISGSITSVGGVLRIGGDSIWGEYFRGLIDEVRVYNRVLSAAEILTDMTTPIQ